MSQSWIQRLVRVYKLWQAPRPASFFCASWYLDQYPDVARSNMDPWLHFHHHGRHEGRLACADHLDFLLAVDSETGLETLRRVELAEGYHQLSLTAQDEAYMNWLMARRLGLKSNWDGVVGILGQRNWDIETRSSSRLVYLPRLMYCDALNRAGRLSEADACVRMLLSSHPEISDMALMKSNLAMTQGHYDRALSAINALFSKYTLVPVTMTEGQYGLDHLAAPHDKKHTGPLVTVIIPAWNAEKTIAVALSSLQNQTHENLEILVVDDASTDQTALVVQHLAQQDSRIRLLPQTLNRGPFAVRNIGLAEAAGDFITVHDSDDWSHPQKIECQVQALQDTPTAMASQSAWVRATDALYFGGWNTAEAWWEGWVHRNTSSLMIRRNVVEILGYWDEVRCSADGEYVQRIKRAWGSESIVMVHPLVPMAFGRVRETSLTQSRETHLLTTLKGLRHDYHRAYARWHASAETIDELYVAPSPQTRPFSVSDAMLHRGNTPPREAHGHSLLLTAD